MTLSGFSQKKGFTVTGTIGDLKSDEAYLIELKNNKPDTLTKAAIIDGAFKMTGQVKELTTCQLVFKGLRGGMPIFIENTDYVVTLSRQDTKVEGGGDAQKLSNQFNDLQLAVSKKSRELQSQFQAAQQSGDKEKMEAIKNEYSQAFDEMQTNMNALIKANPNSVVSAFYVYTSMQGAEYEPLKAKYDLLGDKAKSTEMGKAIAEKLNKMESLSVGQVAPDFTLETPDGGQLSLYQVKGKLKLIDFWASWCGPCRGENPHVVALYNEYHPKGLEIISVSLDNQKNAWVKAIQDDGLIWQHCSDLKGWQSSAVQLYQVTAIPHTVLLDENNRIIAKNLRGDALKAKVAELLK